MRSRRPSRIPLLHIADPTARADQGGRLRRVGLLGTAFTMEQDFYKGRLQQRHGLDVIVPDEDDRRDRARDHLQGAGRSGRIRPESRQAYREIIARLIERGAQGVILGCTEIMLLVSDEDSAVPLFDTTTIHARGGGRSGAEGWIDPPRHGRPCAGHPIRQIVSASCIRSPARGRE